MPQVIDLGGGVLNRRYMPSKIKVQAPWTWYEADAIVAMDGDGVLGAHSDLTPLIAGTAPQALYSNTYSKYTDNSLQIVSDAYPHDGRFMVSGASDSVLGNGDWTIEGWFLGSSRRLFTSYLSAGSYLYMDNYFGGLRIRRNGITSIHTFGGGFPGSTSTWTHMSLNYNENTHTLELFANGISIDSIAFNYSSHKPSFDPNEGIQGNQHIDRYQIVQRVLRTANFDPELIY